MAIPIPQNMGFTLLPSHKSHPADTSLLRTLVPYNIYSLKYAHSFDTDKTTETHLSSSPLYLRFPRNKHKTSLLLILFYFIFSLRKVALITHRPILLMPNATSEWLIKSTLPPLSISPSKNFPGKSNSRKTILKLRTFYGSSRRYYEEQQKFKVFCTVREEDNNKRNGKFGF